MMKKLFYVVVVMSLYSCQYFKSKDEASPNDSLTDVAIGGDKDEHGCLTAAGYTWSKLNEECVRVFSGIDLLPVAQDSTDATLAAYVFFDETGKKAEVFLPGEKESIILERDAKSEPWTAEGYKLTLGKEYELRKGNTLLYKGDTEPGGEVTGTDDTEEPVDSIQE